MGLLSSLRGKGFRSLIEADLRGPSTASWRRRLGCYRRGFLSTALLQYGVEDASELDAYVPELVQRTHARWINAPFLNVLDNKYIFGRMIRDFAPTPEMVALVRRGRVETLLDEPRLDGLEALIDRHADGPGLVFRHIYGRKGQGVHILRHTDDGLRLDDRPATRDEAAAALARYIGETPYVVTVWERQSDFAARFYPRATNTVRLMSMIDPETDEPFLPFAVYRLGTSGSMPSDNWARGGLSVEIDIETGALSRATRFPFDGRKEWFDAHPETGVPIAGEVVPGWAEVAATMHDVARHLRCTPYVGWDLLLTPSGFTIIEGNNNPDLDVLQVHRPMLDDPRTLRFFRHYGVAP